MNKRKSKYNGLSSTREYKIWARMIDRCYRTKNPNYWSYGGRGTIVCQRWKESFFPFLEDMGEAPSTEHTLDRINTHGHYSCGKCSECEEKGLILNCRWATKEVQDRNQRSNRYYTFNGETLILKDWARKMNIHYLTLWYRINRGVPFEKAILIKKHDRTAITKAKKEKPNSEKG